MCISLKTEICHFVHIIIIIHNIIIILFHWPTAFDFQLLLKKNYTAFLTESFCVSVTYLKMHTRQIANQPSLENFQSSLTLHWKSSIY